MPAPLRPVTTLLTGTVLLAATALGAGCVGAVRDAPAPAPVAAAAPEARPVVLLDPGHNGGNARSPGAINRKVTDGRGGRKPCNSTGTATDAGYPEHAFTWDLAQRIRGELQRAGVTVVMTRPDDEGVGPCVDERGRAGARAHAVAAVSLHADGAAAGARGFHVAYSDPPLNTAQSAPATRLATTLRDSLRAGRFAPAGYIGRDGLDGRDDLGGLNTATVPTALVECANMRNPAEAKLVSSPQGRQRYATAITNGIMAFVRR